MIIEQYRTPPSGGVAVLGEGFVRVRVSTFTAGRDAWHDAGMTSPGAGHTPLSALLSFALVAYTIEFDNESEHILPHRTTDHGSGSIPGPWLVSMAMGFNCLRFVPEEGITMRELERRARTRTNWDGMRRWGYIRFEADPGDNRAKPPASALLVRTTTRGRLVKESMPALLSRIEERWRKRFGNGAILELRRSLIEVAGQQDPALPDCMPILRWGLVTEGPKARKPRAGREAAPVHANLEDAPLPGLLARVLVALALEFEEESDVSLAICANVLRVMEDEGTAVRALPERSGVSKESIAMAFSFLTKRGYARVLTDPSRKRTRVVLPTPRGAEAREKYPRLLRSIEGRWAARYGKKNLEELRAALKGIAADGTAERSPLFRGLEPHPEGWRAKVRRPTTLPHYPMVLHRGGYPDGS